MHGIFFVHDCFLAGCSAGAVLVEGMDGRALVIACNADPALRNLLAGGMLKATVKRCSGLKVWGLLKRPSV